MTGLERKGCFDGRGCSPPPVCSFFLLFHFDKLMRGRGRVGSALAWPQALSAGTGGLATTRHAGALQFRHQLTEVGSIH